MSDSEYRVVEHLNFKSFDEFYGILFKTWETRISSDSNSDNWMQTAKERVVSSIKVLKRKITEVEEETPQETVISTKRNKKTIDKEAEKVVQASTSSDINKKVEAQLKRGRVNKNKRYFKRQINKYKLRIKKDPYFSTVCFIEI
ncbi:hypothetical protein BpHYR1_051341 [Brachionus plicatilis]|uniref:Uncharacterized protein n=1 Tax=Brachionus plicatilis TaxID=10195 RepID=A0A3M7QB42_BRAPC|nr:hypothetical protein BpHYR1_051341 [Brachionus plicatilis]